MEYPALPRFTALLAWFIAMNILPVMASDMPKVQIMGLFNDKAVISINGQQTILKAGDEKQGVKLLHADSSEAVIEINGQKKKLGLGSHISTRLTRPSKNSVHIPSRQGVYLTRGLINGRGVQFLVDTGANVVAMSRPTADRLQIPYRQQGTHTRVSTASEIKDAWSIILDTVTVGSITLRRVQANIIDTTHDQEVLLGMSFLGRLKMTQQRGIIVLEARSQ